VTGLWKTQNDLPREVRVEVITLGGTAFGTVRIASTRGTEHVAALSAALAQFGKSTRAAKVEAHNQ
jgi:glutamate/tyrosine decarboxylase-like PLP-dependent enzyme